MYKQKQSGCCCNKRHRMCSRFNKNCKKNKRIVQTYLVTPEKVKRNSIYELIERQKLEALKKKYSDQYILLNPNARYLRNFKTQNQELEDKYVEELKNVKDEIKNLQRNIQEKKPQFQPQPQPQPQPQLYPVSIFHSQNYNPEEEKKKRETPRQEYKRRLKSLNNFYQEDMQNLQSQIKNLRRQLSLSRTLKNTIVLPPVTSINKGYNLSNYKNFQSKPQSRSPKRLESIYVVDPYRAYSSNTLESFVKRQKKDIFRKVRKVVNCIFFISYAKQFVAKLKLKKQNFFKESFQQNIYYQITNLRNSFVKSAVDLVEMLPISESKNLVITSVDNEKQRQVKVQVTRQYLNAFLDLIGQAEFLPNLIKTLTQTCYFVCRHGGKGVTASYFTAEQLDIMCIYKAQLKINSEKHLEKAQIITFIWIKLIVFNILLRTSSIEELNLETNNLWNTNFYLIGSLLYQIARSMQAELISRAPIGYSIGNWKHINFLASKNTHSKKLIIPCKSMIVTSKPFDKLIKTQQDPNELIQGTITKSYLSEAYQFQTWEIEQRKIMNLVKFIHKKMCKYHEQLKMDLK